MTVDPSSSPPSFLPPSPSLLIALWACIQDTFLPIWDACLGGYWGIFEGGYGGYVGGWIERFLWEFWWRFQEHLPSPLSFPIL
ncbi:hypothetical protein AGABI1DRAFT_132972 [Agaricus bisporus var. burnettii JB137-S8]|uniref:Uncharacterized protein n=1 Tax=Agaricus bisporus var. burnettii (strain JB137-S8 / ATCC MYA-4627 / FGSC 10392) TaxID=597362 RepID=K5WHI3_AGABU|nr:uncharacterized protein AGABI1DRAFT_132972 [Agaricus bisporus var. burnettii JB137-S8]EKM74716.1 hypothetical protein AGABI1DRAFT_132972 [Agaricus bisporus var. burnettii JB137-S8]